MTKKLKDGTITMLLANCYYMKHFFLSHAKIETTHEPNVLFSSKDSTTVIAIMLMDFEESPSIYCRIASYVLIESQICQ